MNESAKTFRPVCRPHGRDGAAVSARKLFRAPGGRPGALGGDEREAGGHDGDVMVPVAEGAPLVMVQSQLWHPRTRVRRATVARFAGKAHVRSSSRATWLR